MGKKQFIDKKFSKKFKLLPSSSAITEAPTEEYKPTKKHIEEQRKYGVFYDDNYDYMQHMRARDEGSVLLLEDEVRSVIRAPAIPPSFGIKEKKVVFESDIENALDGIVEASGDLEDDFIAMAGGIVEDRLMMPRMMKPLMEDDSDFEDEDDDDEEDFNRGYNEYDMEDEEEEEKDETAHDGADRDVDAAFEAMLEADYSEDQMGELEGEAFDLTAGMEPSDWRVRKLVGEKRGLPEYDEQLAKKYVRDRIKYLEKHGGEETEEVEVDVAASKKMKWDCESFATQYSTCYNHPSLIKEGGLSRRAIKRLEKKNAPISIEENSENEDEDMEEDMESVCTTATTIRRRGETTEERKMRKSAVKEARKQRRMEKKENQTAFAIEHRKATASRFGQIKSTPIV
ncbi:hypothetical protein PRIPAC_83311 [Pristionchus pacificus]|nr:hypothetical protein PRIPAC_83311 [Pristionchus pacificus]